jgi:hypothetical protein
MSGRYAYLNPGRSPRTVGVLALVYGGLGYGLVALEMAWGIAAVLGAFTLPALWDLASGRDAGLSLDDGTLNWHSGRYTGTARLDEIDHVRFDTRLDLSVRVTLVMSGGEKTRLPQESCPPHKRLEAELQTLGVRTERHHFSLM